MFSTSFTELFLTHSRRLADNADDVPVPVSSYDLSVADVVAVSRHLAQVELTPEANEAIARCSDIVLDKLRQGHVIYGVNTGFGGSADARSADTLGLQQTLFSMQMCGILSMGDGVLRPGDKTATTQDDTLTIEDVYNDTSSDSGSEASTGTRNSTSNSSSIAESGFTSPFTSPSETDKSYQNIAFFGDEKNRSDTGSTTRRDTLSWSGGESLFQETEPSPILEAVPWTDSATLPRAELQTSEKTTHESVEKTTACERRSPNIMLPLDNPMTATCMPESWARAAMLVRLNSLAEGASGIRVTLADCLVDLLNKDVVPCIPLRGSISASGDLSPLSYVGAVMQGKPSAMAFSGPRTTTSGIDERKPTRADVALLNASISPITIAPKEGLAIVNGTAVSAGVAALALHESMNLAAFCQVLTAMSVEALTGSVDSFHPFIGRVRPHPGQVDSARNIYSFLSGSKLATSHLTKNAGELAQDRYSIRTASQWIGPVLENLQLAFSQITIELNSVTDNPLIDTSVPGGHIHHGGNFQARAVTSAVEKLRQDLQALGRMLFAQCAELINPATSRGLPPNLCAPKDGPARSFLFKGVDIMIAALVSELGFLANPVGTHVMTAEMGNQGLNSMALVSARYTLTAADVLAQMAAAHLIALCQALDLRALELLKGNSTASSTNSEKLRHEDTTMLLGGASKKMYEFVRKELQVPFLDEAHVLAGVDDLVAGDEGTAPSVGMYVTKVYESMKSGRLYEVVSECLAEVK
ncbi:phenylalanine ammonia-lyase [Apiospora arundinis]|uniref:Phenylalanine ammonia-lyase n=1 Tax=Apiospora arundinis TaxID=335852 RepID=A0ABR2ISY8_9PEZI